ERGLDFDIVAAHRREGRPLGARLTPSSPPPPLPRGAAASSTRPTCASPPPLAPLPPLPRRINFPFPFSSPLFPFIGFKSDGDGFGGCCCLNGLESVGDGSGGCSLNGLKSDGGSSCS
ncbi:unnamed protein product, partial [Urochloa humidicola]